MTHNETFLLIRSSRRTLALEIKPDASLVVRAPRRTPLDQVRCFVEKHAEWIDRKQTIALTRPRPEPRSFIDGEEFWLLGHSYRLQVVETSSPDVVFDGRLLLSITALPRAREVIIKWYKAKAREIFRQRVAEYGAIMGCQPTIIRITSPRRRWGSCGAGGGVNFNWKLVMAPLEVVDYLVVHELAHLKCHGHDREFWSMVKRYCPDYLERQRWLKDNGYRLEI
ncbi:SprT family zinc-dependent metalloprotease [Candidatus Dehalogenimonas loeffleri]|uniref:SprT family zinc-dependent metalloprotease n=1 Tax=Candidatus Dehalogenimonas loeffleri TaxID=3127115 RepID=A0ABZ2JAW2_9CHLR